MAGVTGIGALVVAIIAYLFPLRDDPPTPNPLAAPTSLRNQPSPSTLTSQPSPSTQPAPASTLTSPTQEAPVLFNGEVRLGTQTGADLEGGRENGQIGGTYSEGISGSTDLYLDYIGLLHTAHDTAYEYQGRERETHAGCAELINSGRPPSDVLAYPGNQFCFVTSDDHPAWARISTSTTSSFTGERYIILQFKVWE